MKHLWGHTAASTLTAGCSRSLRSPGCTRTVPGGRGLYTFTFQLNVSAFCGIGGARKGCVARVKGVLGGV